MKCIKCLTKNINQANYCKKCGYKFSDGEREAASRWTLVWILEKGEKLLNIVQGKFEIFGFITNTKIYKVLSLIFVLGLGIFSWIVNGLDVKIRESDAYNLQYNIKEQEYYVFVNEKETLLNMYLPNDVESIALKNYNSSGDILEEKMFTRDDEVIIEANSDEYYVLTAKQGSKETDFKMFVYLGEVNK